MLSRGLSALLLTLAVSGAAAGPPAEVAPAPTPGAPAAGGALAAPYRIGVGDVLRVEVYGEPSLSGEYTVQADGSVVFPLVGSFPAAGLETAVASERLTRLLGQDYLYDPKVSVTVKQYLSQKVELLGNVARPGTYFLDRPTRLLDLLALAGGLSPASTEILRGQQVRVVRRGAAAPGGEPTATSTTILVDLHDLLVGGDAGANLLLEGGDVVYVPKTQEVQVVGEVKKPGPVPYEEGLTVLKAISLAGGTTPKAALKKVIVRRIRDGQEQQVKARMEDQLRPEDVVEVPVGFW